MGQGILIIGESGTGKSRSIKTLDPETTFLIKIIDKPLPFKESKKLYKKGKDKEGKEKVSAGNLFVSRSSAHIVHLMKKISDEMPKIKNIVIDDFQYLMSYEFMDRAMENNYQKFTEIGLHAFNVFKMPELLREEINVYFFSHNDDDGKKSSIKTIGKMLDQHIKLEGMHTFIFHTSVNDGKYLFLTNNDGYHVAKTPDDMFDSQYIDNDLGMIDKVIREYEE